MRIFHDAQVLTLKPAESKWQLGLQAEPGGNVRSNQSGLATVPRRSPIQAAGSRPHCQARMPDATGGKNVAAGILPAREPGFQPGGIVRSNQSGLATVPRRSPTQAAGSRPHCQARMPDATSEGLVLL